MGEVYRADDLELNQSVALKFLPAEVARNAADLARLRQEVRVARQIAHPNVCRTYDISEADGQVFVVMEYVDGEDLASVLRRLGRPTSEKALEIARQLCLGLGAAHENGVLHRDLKPANIMIDGRGRVRITDFGLAGTAEEIAAEKGGGGTPAYMAPEQANSGKATVQSDIYSLGLVLFELFTGKRAADVTPRPDPARPDSDSGPRTPSSLVGDIDPVVERVILRCLERDPARRPQSAYVVFGALPGGDPLAAAVAAGETPSPELVASAGVEGTMKPLHAGLAVLATLLGFLALSAMQTPLFKGLHVPNNVLALRADDMLARIMATPVPRYSADGMRYEPAPGPQPGKDSPPGGGRSAGSLARREPTLQYWHRRSPVAFSVSTMHVATASLTDPPQTSAGSATIVLDMSARLLALEAVPPAGIDSLAPRAPNWGAVLEAAGRDPALVRAVTPPPSFDALADSVAAWRLSDSAAVETTLVAAALHGRVIRVETIAGSRPLGALGIRSDEPSTGLQRWLVLILVGLIATLGGIVLVVRNLRARRGDVRGAWIIGVSVCVLTEVGYLASVKWSEVGAYQLLTQLLYDSAAGHALFHGVTMAIFYLAMEPYVRRLWPNTLVSWARIVAGRHRDPIVGRDLLVGSGYAAVISALIVGSQVVERHLGLQPPPPLGPAALALSVGGIPAMIAFLCQMLTLALLRMTSMIAVVVVLRFLVRRSGPAILAVVVILIVGSLDYSSRSLAIDAAIVTLFFTGVFLVTFRFGVVAAIATSVVTSLADTLPWTLDFGSWIAPQTVVAWGIVAAILGYAFVTAVGGRALFSDPLSDSAPAGRR